MNELDLSTLNPGIRNLVAYLRARGFDTCDSGDGVTHEAECDRDYAYVSIETRAAHLVPETHRLVDVVLNAGIRIRPQSMANEPCIQATYDPANGVAIIDLMHVTDAMLAVGMPAWLSVRIPTHMGVRPVSLVHFDESCKQYLRTDGISFNFYGFREKRLW